MSRRNEVLLISTLCVLGIAAVFVVMGPRDSATVSEKWVPKVQNTPYDVILDLEVGPSNKVDGLISLWGDVRISVDPVMIEEGSLTPDGVIKFKSRHMQGPLPLEFVWTGFRQGDTMTLRWEVDGKTGTFDLRTHRETLTERLRRWISSVTGF
jgi:hypothetical protein